MADTTEKAAKQLKEITECPICMNVFTDPRVLPCIHTFCLDCLKRIGETTQKGPGHKLPCPLCRKEFIIPADGLAAVPKNFFVENLLQYKLTLQMGSTSIICDLCSATDESKTRQDLPTATVRCLECQDNYCDGCVKIHQYLKVSRNHKLMKIGDYAETSIIKRVYSVKYCSEHTQKPLEYYCAECRKIVCVSCFVERHKLHNCKDIASVDEDFRQTIEKNGRKISNLADETLVMRKSVEKRKADFLMDIVTIENAIHKRNQELKEMIDRDTKLVLIELSAVKSNQLKEMEDELEMTDRDFTILKGFEDYCTELVSKGSASDICSSYDELVLRADGLKKDHETFVARPHISFEVSFEATYLEDIIQTFDGNVMGIIHGNIFFKMPFKFSYELFFALTIATWQPPCCRSGMLCSSEVHVLRISYVT